MNAQELYTQNGQATQIWFCATCRKVRRTQEEAKECCNPHECSYCGKPCAEPYRTAHAHCTHTARQQTLRAKAEHLETWDGLVFWEDISEFFTSLDELMDDWCDRCEDDWAFLTRPDWVWATKPVHPREILVDWIYDRFIDQCTNMEDDSQDPLELLQGKAELEAAVARFNELNKDVIFCYGVDETRLVRVPWSPEDPLSPHGYYPEQTADHDEEAPTPMET